MGNDELVALLEQQVKKCQEVPVVMMSPKDLVQLIEYVRELEAKR